MALKKERVKKKRNTEQNLSSAPAKTAAPKTPNKEEPILVQADKKLKSKAPKTQDKEDTVFVQADKELIDIVKMLCGSISDEIRESMAQAVSAPKADAEKAGSEADNKKMIKRLDVIEEKLNGITETLGKINITLNQIKKQTSADK